MQSCLICTLRELVNSSLNAGKRVCCGNVKKPRGYFPLACLMPCTCYNPNIIHVLILLQTYALSKLKWDCLDPICPWNSQNGCLPFVMSCRSCWIAHEGSAVCLALLSLHVVVPLKMPERNHALQAAEVAHKYTCSSAQSVCHTWLLVILVQRRKCWTLIFWVPFSMNCPPFWCAAHLSFPRGVSLGLGEARSCLDPNHMLVHVLMVMSHHFPMVLSYCCKFSAKCNFI